MPKRTLEVARHLVEDVRARSGVVPLYQAIDVAVKGAVEDPDFVARLVENPTNDVISISIEPEAYEAVQSLLEAKFKKIPARLLVEAAIAYSIDQSK